MEKIKNFVVGHPRLTKVVSAIILTAAVIAVVALVEPQFVSDETKEIESETSTDPE